MLMSMSASLVQLEFLDEEKKEEEERLKLLNVTTKKEEISEEDDDDDWDGGLEIAEELVKHLQQRRRSNSGLERSFERRFKGPMKNWRK
jgi:hypothetical protein